MATFAAWLGQQTERDDWTGHIARWWEEQADVRPRVFSPSGVQKYLDDSILKGSGQFESMPDDRKGEWRKQYALAVKDYHNRVDAGTTPKEDVRLARIEAKLDQMLELLGLLGRSDVQAVLNEVTGMLVTESDQTSDEVSVTQEAADMAVESVTDYEDPQSIITGWNQLHRLADHAGAETAEADDDAA
jgi:hypothetical protein